MRSWPSGRHVSPHSSYLSDRALSWSGMSEGRVDIESWPSTVHTSRHPHLSPTVALCCVLSHSWNLVSPSQKGWESEWVKVKSGYTPGHNRGTAPSEYAVCRLSCYLMPFFGVHRHAILPPHPLLGAGPQVVPSRVISSTDAGCLGFAPHLAGDSLPGLRTPLLWFVSIVECRGPFSSTPGAGPGLVSLQGQSPHRMAIPLDFQYSLPRAEPTRFRFGLELPDPPLERQDRALLLLPTFLLALGSFQAWSSF